MWKHFARQANLKGFLTTISLLIAIIILIIPSFTASFNNSIDQKQQNNLNNENIIWLTGLDVTSDGLDLISINDKLDFQKCFNKITFKISELSQEPAGRASSIPKIEFLYSNTILANELEKLEAGPDKIIRGFNENNLDLKHTFEEITGNTNQGSTTTAGIKQTVTLNNPTPNHRNFQVSYIVESQLQIIKWNNEVIKLTSEKTQFQDVPSKVTLLDNNLIEQGTFDWNDLTTLGFSTDTYGYLENGITIIECILTVTLAPWTNMDLDPSYIIIHVSNLKLYNDDQWAEMGSALASGDFNGDGYGDLAFTAPKVWTGPKDDRFQAGEIYILFGKPRQYLGDYLNFTYNEDVIIYGASDENTLNEASLAVGDINFDGYDDLVIGAPMAESERGLGYVIFGNKTPKKVRDFGTSTGYDIKITGSDVEGLTGSAVTVGDVNGDNFGDILISSPDASYGSGIEQREFCGKVHVIYGNTTMSNSYRLGLEDHYDMQIIGEDIEDHMGQALASGDINGDGVDDLVLGAPEMDAGFDRTRHKAGNVIVIFGNDNLTKEWDLRYTENFSLTEQGMLNGNITIMGYKEDFQSRGSQIGKELEVADLNNDNFEDIIIGVPLARGKSGYGSDIGEIYIIYGDTNDNLPLLFDTKNITRDGYIIYGKDNGDLFGSSLEAKDISGDGIKDIIIGAPGGWGVSDDAKQTGETYILYGSSQKVYGYLDDLVGSKDILIFYGDKPSEQCGSAVSAGDMDNDGTNEIIVGAPKAESANGSFFEVGRIDIIFELNITSQISHVSYSLLDGGGPEGNICYAGIEHTFRVEVAHSRGIEQLNFTQLGLEPLGPNIQFRWYQKNNSFFEISDRFGYGSINSSSSTSRRITNNRYELEFKVIFNFMYPTHRMSAIQLYSLGNNLSVPAAVDKYDDIYMVENGLKFVGSISAVAAYQGKLNQGYRVHSREKIIWSGLKVVYNGTTDLYPNDDFFDVSVWDDDGDFWTDYFSSGEEIEIISEADAEDDISDIHKINITNIPEFGVGLSEENFEIKVEATKISFTEHKPDSSIWHGTKDIKCSVVISDLGGWEINGSSIEYSISTAGAQEEKFGPWTSASQAGQQMSYSVSVNCQFENGENNYIRWRAKNIASQIYGGSELFLVRVDIEPVFYTQPTPAHYEWQYSTGVECGIIIVDNLSGVDQDSIEYRYKDMEMIQFTAWSKDDLTILKNENTFECKVTLTFKPGTDNFIQWHAVDELGNPDQGSSHYRIKITTEKPISILSIPLDGTTTQEIDITVKWSGKDPNDEPLIYDIYFSQDIGLVEQLDPTVRIAASISELEYTITNLENGGKYYWTVIPFDNKNFGECQSGVWSFIVYLPPPVCNLVVPRNGSTINSNSAEFLWKPEYKGLELVRFDLYVDTIYPPIADAVATDITTNSYQYTGLEDGKTYFWFVVPKVETLLGEVKGESKPPAFTLRVDTDAEAPEVKLKQPENGQLVTTRQPTLSWELIFDNPDRENVTFLILLDTIPNPAHMITNFPISTTNYTIVEPLNYNITYYWRVIPIIDHIEGRCLSGIWSFIITPIIPGFDIELTLDKSIIKSYPGSTGELKFTVKNLANINDTIIIKLEAQGFNQSNFYLVPNKFELGSDEAGSGTITILIPDYIMLQDYEISVIADSQGASNFGYDIQVKNTFTLSISKEPSDGDDESNLMYYLMVIIIVIIIIIIILGLLRSRQSRIGVKKSEPKKTKHEMEAKPSSKPLKPQKPKSKSTPGDRISKPTKKGRVKDK